MKPKRGLGRVRWRLRELSQTLWVRVAAFAVIGLLTAAIGYLLQFQIPEALAERIGTDAIEPILQIVASSMLTVTTFSLSILTAAYATASSGSTPRAVQLLVRDGVSQTVLATFIGAFVFSLVGLIMLKTQLYGGGGRVVLFVVTLIVIVIVIVSLLRWINRLGELGLIGDNLGRVEEVTSKALNTRLESPFLGANPMRGPAPASSRPLMAPLVGYVQTWDMNALSDLADDADLVIHIAATPGDLVHPATPMLHVRGLPAEPDRAQELRARLIGCATLRPDRTFDQDPRFGFRVLSEIGQRALSPAVNDPGTAIAVTVRIMRILSDWTIEVEPAVTFPRLHLRSITALDILGDALLPLARDGAGTIEMQRALQHCLLALTRMSPDNYAEAAIELSNKCLAFAQANLTLPDDIAEIEALSALVRKAAAVVVPSKALINP